MVRTIQSETKSAVEVMHTGSQDVEVGVAKTTESGANLSQIIQVAEKSAASSSASPPPRPNKRQHPVRIFPAWDWICAIA